MNRPSQNFLGLSEKHGQYDTARYAILPIPYDGTTSYTPGTRFGPAAIIDASHHVEWFDEELLAECYRSGIATLEPLVPNVAGPEAMQQEIFRRARRIVRDGKFPFGMGGEHGISAALIRAVMTRHRKLSVLQIDAHCDLRDEYLGSPYSHASVMRRVLDMGATIVPVGIRSVAIEDYRCMKRAGIQPITARECHTDDNWLDATIDALGDTVYITIDIDAFDPAYAPGTGTPEPGGLDWYQVTALLRLVTAEKKVVGADLVEVSPIPGQTVTQFLAARLIYKLICYLERPA